MRKQLISFVVKYQAQAGVLTPTPLAYALAAYNTSTSSTTSNYCLSTSLMD